MKVWPVAVDYNDNGDPIPALCELFTADGWGCENRATTRISVECCGTIANVCGVHKRRAEAAIPDCQALPRAR